MQDFEKENDYTEDYIPEDTDDIDDDEFEVDVFNNKENLELKIFSRKLWCTCLILILLLAALILGIILVKIWGEKDNSSYKDFDYKIIQNGEVQYIKVDEPEYITSAYDRMSELDKRTTIVCHSDMEILSAFQNINPDVMGVIRIDGTVLNHAFCVDDGTDEYIRKDLYGRYNSYGTPYLDYRCAWLKSGRNHIIYGHNIPEGDTDVFAPLSEYESSDYYKKHPVITTVTETGAKNWLIVAYYLINTADEGVFRYTDLDYFNSKAGFEEYMSEVEKRNWLSFKTCPYEFGDTFLTLSSCSLENWGTGTNRMVVLAKLLDTDEEYNTYVNGVQHVWNPLLPGQKEAVNEY